MTNRPRSCACFAIPPVLAEGRLNVIATCDVFFYVGGESDDWVDDALQESVNPDMISLSLLDAMGGDVKTEEIVEGMEHEHDEEREH